MATKQTKVKLAKSNKLYASPLFLVIFAVVFAGIGYGARLLTHAAPSSNGGGSSISMISNSTDGVVHYSSSVSFNWSTNYKNSDTNTYFNPNIEVVCYQNGKWTGMGHVYRMSVSPTPAMALTGSHNYTFAEGDLNRLDYAWYTNPAQLDQTKPETCRAALYHFSKGNNKYSEMAFTTFDVKP